MKNKELYKLLKKVNKSLEDIMESVDKISEYQILPTFGRIGKMKKILDPISVLNAYITYAKIYRNKVDEYRSTVVYSTLEPSNISKGDPKLQRLYLKYMGNLNKLYVEYIDHSTENKEMLDLEYQLFNTYDNIFGYPILKIPKEKKKGEK